MKSVTSRQNPVFKSVRDAIREHTDQIVIEGPKAVSDALRAGWEPVTIVSRSEPSGIHDREVVFSAELFDAVAEARTPQNVLGVFVRPRWTLNDLVARAHGRSIIVALDGVQDPGNVGTIVRLAAAFDVAGVALLPGCADAFGPKAVRASVGAILDVPVTRTTPRALVGAGLPLVATALEGAVAAPPLRDAIVVFGSEGSGVSQELLDHASTLKIAMSDRVESLNVAASAAILLWQSYSARMR